MEFRTPVPVSPCPEKISHNTPVLMLGSCFSDHMGGRMTNERFKVLANPFGVVYNPFSIALLLKRSLDDIPLRKDELFEEGDVFKSFLFHSSFAAQSASELQNKANEALRRTSAYIKQASFLILTFGTARYYRHNAGGNIVANCHKQPPSVFTGALASPDECFAEIKAVIDTLRAVNPGLFIIFTISPVRYLKDGNPGAQQDKAVLFVALEQWLKIPRTWYFPAYEILIDELRDYRFYAGDMVHPSAVAADYIYEKLGEACYTGETTGLARRIGKLMQAKSHRPLFPESQSYNDFLKKTEEELNLLKQQFPFIDF